MAEHDGQLAGTLTGEITQLDKVTADLLAGHEVYAAIQATAGHGPAVATVIVAEIGDIRRYPGPGQLGSWADLMPRHYAAARRSAAPPSPMTRCSPSPFTCAGRS